MVQKHFLSLPHGDLRHGQGPGHGLLLWAFILLQLKLSREGPNVQEDGEVLPAAPTAQHKGASERTWARAWSPAAFQGRFAPSPAQLPRQWAEGGAEAASALLEPQPRCPGVFEAAAEPQQWLGPSPADLGLTKASPHRATAPAQGQAGKALGTPLTVSIPCLYKAGMAA